MTPPVENGVSCFLFFLYLLSPLIFLESLFDGKKCFKLYSCSIDILVCELVQQGGYFILTRYLLFDDGHESLYASWLNVFFKHLFSKRVCRLIRAEQYLIQVHY